MKNPDWYDNKVFHKAIYIGPARLPVPLCKLAFREFWPASGCADGSEKAKRKWSEVECFQCMSFAPEKDLK